MHNSALKSKIAVCRQLGDITKYKNTKSSRDVPRISRNDKKIYFFVVCAALCLETDKRDGKNALIFTNIHYTGYYKKKCTKYLKLKRNS